MLSRINYLILLLIFCLILPYSPRAQSTPTAKSRSGIGTLAGQPVDPDGAPIELGNILLLSPVDSSLIRGEVFMDGHFSLSAIPVGPLLLRITALGFEDYFQQIEWIENQVRIDLGEIPLKVQMLDGIEVVASRNILEVNGTNLIVHVANTALSDAGTALDVLRNAPKVFLNRAGQISIIGRGSALIYLDGQRIASSTILSNLSSNDIKRIEIIENPSAKYDAEGNAVINIITKSKSLAGHKIGLLQRFGKGKFYRSYFQLDGYRKAGNWMLQAGYGARPWSWGGRNRQTRSNKNWDVFSEVDNQFEQKNIRFDHNFNLRTSYEFENTKIGLQYTGTIVDGDKEALNLRSALSNQQDGFTINSRVNGPYLQHSNTLTTYFQKKLDTLGSNFQLTAQLSGFNFERQERIEQVLNRASIAADINRRSSNTNAIKIFTIQADHQKSINKRLTWEQGLKLAQINNNSTALLEAESENQHYLRLPNFSNEFSYDEQIVAGYSQIKYQHQSTEFIAGLRGEWTKTAGTSGEDRPSQLIDRAYFNIFPSASIRVGIQEHLSTTVGYSYRISRPLFQDLNPYILFVDSLVSLRGNPTLVPEYSHNISASIQWHNWNLALNFVHTKNKINQIFRSLDPNNPDVISFVKENLDHTKLFGATLSRPFHHKGYSGYFAIGAFYDDHRIEDTGQLLVNTKPGYYFQLNQSLELPWKLKLDVIFNYNSSRVDGVYVDDPISYLNVSVSRRFFKDQLKVSLWGNDILDDFKYTGISNFNNMFMTYLSEGDFHFIRLSLNWDFGKLSTGGVQARQVSKAELNRINRSQN